jgi:hypothetical protein
MRYYVAMMVLSLMVFFGAEVLSGYPLESDMKGLFHVSVISLLVFMHPALFAGLIADLVVPDYGNQAWYLVFCAAIAPFFIALFTFYCREFWYKRILSGCTSMLLFTAYEFMATLVCYGFIIPAHQLLPS